MFLSFFLPSLLALASPDPAVLVSVRRVAVLLPEGWALPELERWASFAKRRGIEVGEWRATIASVRRATGAPLLYASNWAAGAPNVGFWDALDAIGANFYDPLSADPNAADAALVAGVRRAARPLARLAARTGRPVLFAEAGYPPAKGAWTAPHDEDSPRPSSPEDAARSIRAVFAALEGEKWWKGVYWWKAFSDGRDAGQTDRGFNFLGRPAGEAIAAGFRRLAASGSGTR